MKNQKNQIQQFHSDEFGSLEILMIDDKPYFPATECAKVLGYAKPHDAVSRHCHDSVKHGVIDRLGREQEVNYIPEGDLYRLIIRSKLPAAVRFEKWIFDTVLPMIRKHGAYVTDAVLEEAANNEEFIFGLLKKLRAEKDKTEALLDKVEELAPKAMYCDLVLQSKSIVPISIIAKDYGMSANSFNTLLHGLKIQYKTGGCWLLYQQYSDKGYTKTRTYYINETVTAVHTYWTQAGRLFLYEILKWHGILPLMEAKIFC